MYPLYYGELNSPRRCGEAARALDPRKNCSSIAGLALPSLDAKDLMNIPARNELSPARAVREAPNWLPSKNRSCPTVFPDLSTNCPLSKS
jgi:hypothetical protein